MKKVLVIAPHPDDETLGCGATLLRHIAEGDEVSWLVVTAISAEIGFSAERVAGRNAEIEAVARAYGFQETIRAGFPTMALDTVPIAKLIDEIGVAVRRIAPDTLYLPYRNDAHSDHAYVFDAAVACTKTFRYPSVRSVYVYETLSETEFGLRTDDPRFRPNHFVNVSGWLERKIEVMRLYEGEMSEFPFPRSEVCIRAQAALRGSQAGVEAAEAFMLIKEIR